MIYVLRFDNGRCYIERAKLLSSKEELNNAKDNEKIEILLRRNRIMVKRKQLYSNLTIAKIKKEQYNIKEKIKKEREWKCHWCGKNILIKNDCTIDHVIPKSKFKNWRKAWKEKNLVISCKHCNQNKSDIMPKLNANIQYKAELIKYKTHKLNSNRRKIGCLISSKYDNVEEIAKRDSPYYNLNIFFEGKNI